MRATSENPYDTMLHNTGGGLLIVYNNQREENRFVQPFVVIGRVGTPFVNSALQGALYVMELP